MIFQRSDFWPPIQGGAESIHGYVAPLPMVLDVLGELLGAPLADHPDFIDSEDESDLLGFLEGMAQAAALPLPERVVSAKQLPHGHRQPFSETLPEAGYVIWSEDAFQTWRPMLPTTGFIGPVNLEVTCPRFVATGAQTVFWVLAIVAAAVWLINKQAA